MRPLLCAFAACAATLALAQAEPGAFAPLEETSSEIDAAADATQKLQAFLDSKGWVEGCNAKSDGSTFIVAMGVGTIAAPQGSPSYIASRSRAFAKAMLDAKAEMASYLEQTVATATLTTYAEQGAGGDETPEAQMAKALNAMPDDSLVGKGRRYLHKKMDNLLAAEGEDVSAQRAQAQADYAAASEKAKRLASTETFKREMGAVATALVSGLQAFYTTETKGEIGVVAIWSPALAETAEALAGGAVPTALRKGKKPIREQLPADAELLSTFGVQQKIDENGQLVLVSFAQAAARTANKRAERAAYSKAQLEATAQLRAFAGESVTTNQAMSDAEESRDYDLDGQLPDYRDESAYGEYQKSVSEAMTLQGVGVVKRWSAIHPIGGQKVFGVVCTWSPAASAAAKQAKAAMQSAAQGGAAPGKAAPAGARPAVNKSAAAEKAFDNSGAVGDEDAF